MPDRTQTPHDAAWKQFFALPIVVEHLLRGFFPEVAALLDFSTLRDQSGEWVQNGVRRRGDAAWRADYRDDSGRSLVTFLEFQSTVDAGMARRSLRNVGMAWERMRRAGALDPDGRLRPLFVVIHAGEHRWTAPGAIERVEVSATGEVMLPMSAPYATLDARRHPVEHLPERNLVSTLFELNGIGTLPEAARPLKRLGVWLPDLGAEAEPARAAYAEWLSTTMPAVFQGASASEMVDRLTQEQEENDMAYTVLEENLRREFKEREERGEKRGERRGIERSLATEREWLRDQASRKFGDAVAARVSALLAGTGDTDGLHRVGGWLMDCATDEELIAHLDAAPNT